MTVTQSPDAAMIIIGGMCQVEIDAANEYFRTHSPRFRGWTDDDFELLVRLLESELETNPAIVTKQHRNLIEQYRKEQQAGTLAASLHQLRYTRT